MSVLSELGIQFSWKLSIIVARATVAVKRGVRPAFVLILRVSLIALCAGMGGKISETQVSNISSRPWIDVTAPPYNARGNGSTDDTAAIQAAIDAACAIDKNYQPIVFFPGGTYAVSEPQGGARNTAPIFTGLCQGLTFYGFGSHLFNGGGPSAEILVAHPGSNPGAGPMFLVRGASGNAGGNNFINLILHGYNQAIEFQGTSATDVSGTITNSKLIDYKTGYSNNAPLVASNTQNLVITGGCLETGSGDQDDLLLSGGGPAGTSYILIDGAGGCYWHGSGIHYDKVVPGADLGGLVIRNVVVEGASQPIVRFTNESGGGMTVSNVTINNLSAADNANSPLIRFNGGPGSLLEGINVSAGSAGTQTAIEMQSGRLFGCYVFSQPFGASLVTDGTGGFVGDCVVAGETGIWSEINTSLMDRLRSDYGVRQDAGSGGGSMLEGFAKGNSYASINIDPLEGLMFNDGMGYGFNADLAETTKGTIDVRFAAIMPPTNVTGTPTSGGTLPKGNYYYFAFSTTGNCRGSGAQSAVSVQSRTISLTEGKNAITVTASAPTTGPTPSAYCFIRMDGTSRPYNGKTPSGPEFQSATPSFTDTGGSNNGTDLYVAFNKMVSSHRITPDAWGIDTTSPVKGTLTVSGGYASSISLKSSAYTLTYADSTVEATGTTTITVPHRLGAPGIASRWWVINSGTGIVTLACDSGRTNGSLRVTLSAGSSAWVTADGTNCFAH